jgi:hypothetical protein
MVNKIKNKKGEPKMKTKIENKNRKSKTKMKIKNAILIAITVIAFIILLVSISCLNSENATPFYISSILSFIWLMIFAIANDKPMEV